MISSSPSPQYAPLIHTLPYYLLTRALQIIADAAAVAYKGATNDVQQKLRRVVEVWRQRLIFESPIQDVVESRIDGILQGTS